jgi:predicted dehydrogenase
VSKKEAGVAERRKIQFGIFGGGLMGREFAQAGARWDVLSDLSVRPEIVGVCDVNSKVLAWYVENYPELRVATTDHRELLVAAGSLVSRGVPAH